MPGAGYRVPGAGAGRWTPADVVIELTLLCDLMSSDVVPARQERKIERKIYRYMSHTCTYYK